MYAKIIAGLFVAVALLFVAVALTIALAEPFSSALPRNDAPHDMRADAPRVCAVHVPFDPQLPLM